MSATETALPAGAEELLGEMLDIHGEGLVRILDALSAAPTIRAELLADKVISGLLLIHGLHPVPLEDRVAAALASVRPYLESHGGDVELVSLDEGVAHLRLVGSCDGCASSASTLELAVERALEAEAPDLNGVEVDGAVPRARIPGKTLPLLSSTPATPSWSELELAPEPGRVALARPGLVVANVSGTLLAYRDRCAGCGSSLADGELETGILTCQECKRQFALTLAGRAIGPEDLQLEPVPLLAEDGRVTVAVA